ncbi:unnamed protein product [Sphagnum compactum]
MHVLPSSPAPSRPRSKSLLKSLALGDENPSLGCKFVMCVLFCAQDRVFTMLFLACYGGGSTICKLGNGCNQALWSLRKERL